MSRIDTAFTRTKAADRFTNERNFSSGAKYSHQLFLVDKSPKAAKPTRSYVLKRGGTLLDDSAYTSIENYAASVFRLFIGDGSRIPKHSKLKESHHGEAAGSFSELIKGFISFASLMSMFGRNYGEVIGNWILKTPAHNNKRIFAQIMVCNIVFSENDFKPSHGVFDHEGRLSRIDFDSCFMGNTTAKYESPFVDLNYSYNDFENLPNVVSFRPYNLVFNAYGSEKIDTKKQAQAKILREKLGPDFQREVYESLLKILIMPDFLLREVGQVLESCHAELKTSIAEITDGEDALIKRDKLKAELRKSPGFNQFLNELGREALRRILDELVTQETPTGASSGGYLHHNSHFRKKYVASEFRARSAREMNEKLEALLPEFNRFKKLHPLSGFLNAQIKHLNSCYFSRGSKDKALLFKRILEKFDAITDLTTDSELELLLNKAYQETAMVAHHRRSRSSHLLFGNTPSQSWTKWIKFCTDNAIPELSGVDLKPKIMIDEESLESYNAYRHKILNPLG